MKKTFLSALIFSTHIFAFNGFEEEKKAYIITGPESTGSVFISRVIAYVVGKDAFYKQWNGYGQNGKFGDKVIIFHRSQPYGKNPKFFGLNDFREAFPEHKLYFIITTRDQSISQKSAQNRFNRPEFFTAQLETIAQETLGEIIENENCFIWNYETQVYLKEPYYQKLYEFLEIESNFFPNDLFDANKKYLQVEERPLKKWPTKKRLKN